MLGYIKMLDQNLPLWEVIVLVLALLAIALVLILWWAYGYNLIVVTQQPDSMQPAALISSLL
jgi:ammonia channel protein AmtB